MLPVTDISFGDDGSALTVIFQTAPKGKYYRGLVHGENGILMQYIGLQDREGVGIFEGGLLLFDGIRFEGRAILRYAPPRLRFAYGVTAHNNGTCYGQQICMS